jgi:PIN domain nuclease of toxin-antitoxin system
MRLLLDTHIWIWSYQEPHKLTSEVAQELTNPEHDRYLSPISIWELVILLEKRRIHIQEDFGVWITNSCHDLKLRDAPLTWQVAHETRFMMLSHRDPADRFLVATAKVYDLTLVTADQQLMNAPGLSILQNR